MRKLSIRLRLAAWYSAVLLAGLILFGCTTWFALQQKLTAGMDGRLARQADGLHLALDSEGIASDTAQFKEEVWEAARQMPAGSLIQLRTDTGELIASSAAHLPMPSRISTEPAVSTMEWQGRPFRVLAKCIYCSGRPVSLLIAGPAEEVDRIMRSFLTILLTMIPFVFVLACFGGWWLSRRALAPVDEITNVARSITAQNLSKRLTVPQTGDELQRMSEAWNDVLARLEAAIDRTRQFTADASHELRTPVALIRATADLALRRERSPENYRQSLREILLESKRMTQLTNDLLFLAAADANPPDMPKAPVDLNLLISKAIEKNAVVAEARRIRLNAELGSGVDHVPVNEAVMERLFLILIDNALKFTPPGGSVVVSTAGDKNGAVVSVRDSGPGIHAEAIPHIFERFYRADPSHSPGNGAGLGLSIAETIAAAHGSTIRVESTPGAGSCFSLTLKKCISFS